MLRLSTPQHDFWDHLLPVEARGRIVAHLNAAGTSDMEAKHSVNPESTAGARNSESKRRSACRSCSGPARPCLFSE